MAIRGKRAALLVAAGNGSRAGGELPKQYRKIAGKPVLAHALDRLALAGMDEIHVVIAAGQETLYREAVAEAALPAPIVGGATRRESVRNGLEAIARGGGAEAVLIHDAARPFLPSSVVARLLAALDGADGAVPALPVVDSLARAEAGVPFPREDLFRIQTPQAFRLADILAAHGRWSGDREATDDAEVARAAGLSVAMVRGDEMLEKLTHVEDFERAEWRLLASSPPRTGFGFDVHAFAAGEALWLGGVRIPHARGLAGHSDADVALHALTDALLGAAGAGDIGEHFPPSDPRWRGAPSNRFVEHARALIEARGGRIEHADITIVCEAPRIGPYKEAMRHAIAGMLRLPTTRISVKATTTEGLGFAGRGEGIAAQAVATVRLPEDM